MYPSGKRINKKIHCFIVILVIISVILFWGFSLPNNLLADDDGQDDGNNDLNTFQINANSTSGGTISPDGSQSIDEGESITFTCAASEGYTLLWLRVDDEKLEGITSYTFTDVDSNHTIHAQFENSESSDDNSQDDDTGNSNDQGDDGQGSNGQIDYSQNNTNKQDDNHGQDNAAGTDDDNNFFSSYSDSIIGYLSSDHYSSFYIFYNNTSSYENEIKKILIKLKSQVKSIKNYTSNTENDSNPIKDSKPKKISEKIYDINDLFSIIEINDTNQLLDINAVVKKNKIIKIIDVEDIIDEGNFIEIGQLDLNTDNPFVSAFLFFWGKIKDFSYYYNT